MSDHMKLTGRLRYIVRQEVIGEEYIIDKTVLQQEWSVRSEGDFTIFNYDYHNEWIDVPTHIDEAYIFA